MLHLTQAMKSPLLGPSRAAVNGYRRDTLTPDRKKGDFRDLFLAGRADEYVVENGIEVMKYEDPGKDDFIMEIADRYPDCRFVASHREIGKVINSHHNIKKWGHPIEDVLFQFSACLSIYEELARRGRLFLIDVDDPLAFSLDAFSAFLEATPSGKAFDMVSAWLPVNDLRYQKEKHDGGMTDVVHHPDVARLRETHFWIAEAEARYGSLTRRA